MSKIMNNTKLSECCDEKVIPKYCVEILIK